MRRISSDSAGLPAAVARASRGIEGELSGRLAPGWNVTASASHFRARDRERQDTTKHTYRHQSGDAL